LASAQALAAFTSQNHKVTSAQGQAYLATVCLFCHLQGFFRLRKKLGNDSLGIGITFDLFVFLKS